MGTEAGPSRPAPLPYDDPYVDEPLKQDNFDTSIRDPPTRDALPNRHMGPDRLHNRRDSKPYTNRGGRPCPDARRTSASGKGRGRGQEQSPGQIQRRGRDHERGRGRKDDRRFSEGPASSSVNPHQHERSQSAQPRDRRSLSPASLAIARATGQYSDGSPYQNNYSQSTSTTHPVNSSHHEQSQSPPQPHFNPYFQPSMMQMASNYVPPAPLQIQPAYPGVQPHINPRFAAAFGINVNLMQRQGNTFGMYGGGPPADAHAYNSNGWTVPMGVYDQRSEGHSDDNANTERTEPSV